MRDSTKKSCSVITSSFHLVHGHQHAWVHCRAFDVLANIAVLVCTFVVAARVRVALHNFLPVLAPPADTQTCLCLPDMPGVALQVRQADRARR